MSALETQLREFLGQLADTAQPPPARISVTAAASRGRSLRRWRRVRLTAPPVLAASAVLAVALAGVLPTGQNGVSSHRTHRQAASRQAPDQAAAPRQFNPLVPYASFGWLPAGESSGSGGTGRAGQFLNAFAGKHLRWQVWVYAAGQCQRVGQQVTERSGAHRRQAFLDCAQNPYGGLDLPLSGAAPAINGHQAFAAGGSVVWNYAPGGWAYLSSATAAGKLSKTALRVAGSVRLGDTTAQPVEFAVQLTRLPGDWQVSATSYVRRSGALLADGYSVTRRAAAIPAGDGYDAANLPFVSLSAPGAASCYFYPGGQSVHRVVNGYQVVVTEIPGVTGAHPRSPAYQLCAPEAGGFSVFIGSNGWHPVIRPATLFAHLKLLGPNPAHWVTQPIG